MGFGSPKIRELIKQTNLVRYGVENVSPLPKFREKRKQTCLERYGVENPIALPENVQKSKEAVKSKYGVENISQIPEICERAKLTRIENYGEGDPWVDDRLDSLILQDPDKTIILPNGEINRFAEMRKIVLELKPKEYLFDIGYGYVSEIVYAKRLGIKDPISFTTELKLRNLLNNLGCKQLEYSSHSSKFADCRDLDYVQNAKKLHGVKFNKRYHDMDFYFPKLRLGIEINGLQNHSVNTKAVGKGNTKSKDYHFEKFKAFRESGILMLSFTDYEQDHFTEDYVNIINIIF